MDVITNITTLKLTLELSANDAQELLEDLSIGVYLGGYITSTATGRLLPELRDFLRQIRDVEASQSGNPGTLIRYRRVTRGVRLGSAEPKRIVAETEGHVIYHVWSAQGRSLGEHAITRARFEEQFERKGPDGWPIDN
jgi:hypothetical protein